MNSQGQEFTVFNLLVQAVIGLFILVMIISAINYFEEQKFAISKDRFDENLVFASQQPNGDVLLIEAIAFNKTTITKKYVSLRTGIDEDCIEFEAKQSSAIDLKNSSGFISFTDSLVLDVYIQCNSDGCGSQGISCIVSFGKKLVNTVLE
jgi:hypothetical protein